MAPPLFWACLVVAVSSGLCQTDCESNSCHQDEEVKCVSGNCGQKKVAAMLQKVQTRYAASTEEQAEGNLEGNVERNVEVTRKRGLGMNPGNGIIQCTDAAALGLDDSWFYTWTSKDSKRNKCKREKTLVAREFVPMVVSCDSPKKILWNIEFFKQEWKRLGVKFLLGYNEPDGSHQTCSPERGAFEWLKVQTIANAFDPPLRLVSPSPCSGAGNACPNGGIAYGKSPWLDSFFAECDKLRGCRPDDIEIIGVHDYEGDFDVRDDNLKVRVENIPNNYRFTDGRKRQVWITELSAACGQTSLCRDKINKELKIYRGGNNKYPWSVDDSITQEEHLWYMKQVIPFLESSEDVFRYTFFGIRNEVAFSGRHYLLSPTDGTDDTPSPLGTYYMTAEEGR